MPRLPDYASQQALTPRAAGKTHRLLRQCARHKGVVLVITLLAVVLLAALVLYVFNLGHQSNSRIAAQNEADMAAEAGASWVARTLNTVSMNNVAIARLITNVAVLDAMPMAVAFTYKEQLDAHQTTDPQGVSQAISAQLARGVTDWWARDKLQEMIDRIGRADDNLQYQNAERAQELRILESFDNLFNSPQGDVAPMTFYNAPAGRGMLWQGMDALDEISQISMGTIGANAQANAWSAKQANDYSDSDFSSAVLLPVNGVIPFKRGRFNDFERPVRNGLLPTDTDHKTTNRGPYDTVFGWRNPRGGRRTGHAEQTQIVRGSNNNAVPIGRGTDGDWVTTGREDATAYTVYGPFQWMMYHAYSLRRNSLRYSRFDHWLSTIANIKLHYAFHGGAIQSIIDPEWLIDYDASRTIAQSEPSRIVETAYVVIEIKSRYPINERPLTPEGAEGPNKYWQYVTRHRPSVPWVTRRSGWVDPESWNITKVDDNIWRNDWEYEVYFDRDLGMEPVLNADGQMVPQRVYRVDHYMFAGVNVGEPVQVRNPFNFSSREALPAPTELDLNLLGPNNLKAQNQYLTFMTVVRHYDKKSTLWGNLFKSNSPFPHHMAMAKSQVFNDHSWDLWTQMWRGQLTAFDMRKGGDDSELDRWITMLEEIRELENPPYIPGFMDEQIGHEVDDQGNIINPELRRTADIDDFIGYLRSVESLAPVMLNH